MSTLTDRAAIAYQFAQREMDPEFRAWLSDHLDAVDADGNQVICMFAPDEPTERMMIEVLAYPHAVIIASVVDGNLFAAQLGEGAASPNDEVRQTIRVGGKQRVADLLRSFKAAGGANGSIRGVWLEYSLAGDRNLVLT
jgi:hypothetical protein